MRLVQSKETSSGGNIANGENATKLIIKEIGSSFQTKEKHLFRVPLAWVPHVPDCPIPQHVGHLVRALFHFNSNRFAPSKLCLQLFCKVSSYSSYLLCNCQANASPSVYSKDWPQFNLREAPFWNVVPPCGQKLYEIILSVSGMVTRAEPNLKIKRLNLYQEIYLLLGISLP